MKYRQLITEYLLKNGVSSKSKMYIDLNVRSWYYANASHHFGEMLSRMVNKGLLVRVKKGYYDFANHTEREDRYFSNDPNQSEIFEKKK